MSAVSLVPDSVRLLQRLSHAHYLPMKSIPTPNDNADRALLRGQIELLAGRVSALTADLRDELGINGYSAARLTPEPGRLARLLVRVLKPFLPMMLRRMSRAR